MVYSKSTNVVFPAGEYGGQVQDGMVMTTAMQQDLLEKYAPSCTCLIPVASSFEYG